MTSRRLEVSEYSTFNYKRNDDVKLYKLLMTVNNGKNSCINAYEIQGELSLENSNVFKMSLEVNITCPWSTKMQPF